MASLHPLQSVSTALKKSSILSALGLKDDFNPSVLLDIQYPSSGKQVALGNFITPEEAAEEPKVTFVPSDLEGPSKSYTLLQVDPDAGQYGIVRHWTQTGLKSTVGDLLSGASQAGSGQEEELVKATEPALSKHHGPGPPPGTGDHRYIFLLLEESKPVPRTQELIPSDDLPGRADWDVKKFIEQNGLTLVGANFFLSGRDRTE